MLNTLQRKSVVALSALFILGGCATSQPTADGKTQSVPEVKAETPVQKQTYFLVFHENGRIYAMTDPTIYVNFMNTDEVPLTRTRIGAGPEGETVVFVITKADCKHLDKPTAAEDIFDGRTGQGGSY